MMRVRLKPGRKWSDRAASQLVCDAPKKSGDPTGTLDIRRSYIRLVEAKWRKVSQTLFEALGKRDVLGLAPDKITALPSANKLQALQAWVTDIVSRSLLEGGGSWLRPMITTSYNRAVARAMRLTKSDARPSDSIPTTNALWAFSVSELQGICDAVTQQVTRLASEAVLHKNQPLPLARLVQERVRVIGATRSGAMIELMVVKAFTTGTLDQFEAAGISRVGLVPETIPQVKAKDSLTDAPKVAGPGSRISRITGQTSLRTLQRIRKVARGFEAFSLVNVETAGDGDVCPICEGIEEENPYTINEARSLIPAHPRCRCAFIPVLEEDDLSDFNPHHEPAGSPIGGRFARAPNPDPRELVGKGVTLKRAKAFLASPKAKQIIARIVGVVKDKELQKEAISRAIMFGLYHGAGVDVPNDVEEHMREQIREFAHNAKLANKVAAEKVHSAVTKLAASRLGGSKFGKHLVAFMRADAADDVYYALKALEALLAKIKDDPAL